MRRITGFVILGLVLSVAASHAQRPVPRVPQTPRVPVPHRAEQPATGCGFLGIYPTDIGRRTNEKLGLGDRTGALVAGVVENTGAARAGVQEKDVVTALNGEFITSESHLRRLIMKQTPGTFVRLDLFRNGTTVTVNAEITSRAKYYRGVGDCESTPSAPPQPQIEQRMRDAVKDLELSELNMGELDAEHIRAAERGLLDAQKELRASLREVREQRNMKTGYEGNTGIGLQSMSDQLAAYFRTPSTSGALVNEVADGSPASRAGMQAGDVIIGVNGLAVEGPMDAVRGIVKDSDGSVDVRVVRDGQEHTLQIRTPRGSSAPHVLPDIGAHTAPQRELMRLARQ